jgi:tetratricopeptide (TPR) repeat protein
MRRLPVPALVSAGLVALTLAAYAPLWGNDFIDLDDGLYVWQNPHVLGGLTADNVAWAWTTTHAGFWLPLTWLSLQLDASLCPAGPGGGPSPVLAVVCHAQNLFWHTATVVLLFYTLRRMTGALWRSALVAGLFAVHPLHVESVAWATERKDVLSTFFLVLTVLAYARYAERPSARRYLLVLVCFVLGLLAKPMLVTLPFGLLLLDGWPLGRWARSAAGGQGGQAAGKSPPAPKPLFGAGARGLLLEKLPLLAVAVAASVVTVLAQRGTTAVRPLGEISLSARAANAAAAYGWYLGKTFWPAGMSLFYRHPRGDWQWGPVLAGAAALLALTALVIAQARRRPWLAVGWLWFVGTLVPVIGLLQSGDQARADRFVYVPHVGLLVALVWGAAELLERLRVPAAARAAAAAVCLAGLAAAAAVQVGFWHDQKIAWEHALAVDPGNDRALYNLGNEAFRRAVAEPDGGRARELLDRAGRHYRDALALRPDPRYHHALGLLLLTRGELPEARQELEAALALDPDFPDAADAHARLGTILWREGKADKAEAEWNRALARDPAEAEARAGLAFLQLRGGNYREAALQLAAVARSPEALSQLGVALGKLGHWRPAAQAHAEAVRRQEAQARLLSRPDPRTLDLYRARLDAARREAARQGGDR